jgi:hypothetical protein
MLRAMMSGSPSETVALSSIAEVFACAIRMVGLCETHNIQAFMTCENYMLEADAMQLIGPRLGVRTLSYQYSNLGHVGPGLMTTADEMMLFSPWYQKYWQRDGIAPQKFVPVGYVYDSSFVFVSKDAGCVREQLQEAGAEFVICFFDESLQHDKFGLISLEDHKSDILSLVRLLLDDPTVAVVIKAQFQWNSPSRLPELEDVVDSARVTGRYLELSEGVHRNIVLPAAAGMTADMCIGHSVGGTASLEAALAGTRSILLNPYGRTDGNHELYQKCDILYGSMEKTVAAIKGYRQGDSRRAGLGDWSNILHQFDSYRDGQAAYRIRQILDQTIMHSNSAVLGPESSAKQDDRAATNH